jgi:hypothetical protein
LISSGVLEVEIIDCVINHPSIWADKTQTDQDKCFNYLAVDKSGMTLMIQFKIIEKPIYNWVFS